MTKVGEWAEMKVIMLAAHWADWRVDWRVCVMAEKKVVKWVALLVA